MQESPLFARLFPVLLFTERRCTAWSSVLTVPAFLDLFFVLIWGVIWTQLQLVPNLWKDRYLKSYCADYTIVEWLSCSVHGLVKVHFLSVSPSFSFQDNILSDNIRKIFQRPAVTFPTLPSFKICATLTRYNYSKFLCQGSPDMYSVSPQPHVTFYPDSHSPSEVPDKFHVPMAPSECLICHFAIKISSAFGTFDALCIILLAWRKGSHPLILKTVPSQISQAFEIVPKIRWRPLYLW